MTKEFINAVVNECTWMNEAHPSIHTLMVVENNSNGIVDYKVTNGDFKIVMDAKVNKLNELRISGNPFIAYVDGKIVASFDTNGLKWEK